MSQLPTVLLSVVFSFLSLLDNCSLGCTCECLFNTSRRPESSPFSIEVLKHLHPSLARFRPIKLYIAAQVTGAESAAGITIIAAMKSIRLFEVDAASFNTAALTPLTALIHLRFISEYTTSLRPLSALLSLRDLSIEGVVKRSQLIHLPQSLCSLELEELVLDEPISLEHSLLQLSSLESFTVLDGEFIAAEITAMAMQWPSLTELSLSSELEEITCTPPFKSLTSLSLVEVSLASLGWWSALPRVNKLTLICNDELDAAASVLLGRFSQLRHLTLRWMDLRSWNTAAIWAALGSAKLTKLDLFCSKCSDWSFLSSLTTLTMLHIGRVTPDITPEQLLSLSSLPLLELYLSCDSDCAILLPRCFPRLTSLTVFQYDADEELSEEAVEVLMTSLPALRRLSLPSDD